VPADFGVLGAGGGTKGRDAGRDTREVVREERLQTGARAQRTISYHWNIVHRSKKEKGVPFEAHHDAGPIEAHHDAGPIEAHHDAGPIEAHHDVDVMEP